MGQNLASVHFNESQWAAVDDTIGTLEQLWMPMLVPLGVEGRRRAVKMGNGSEAFVRNTRHVMLDNAAQLPRSLDLDEMGRDLASHDALAQRRARMAKLMELLLDTDIALGSDAMAAALQGYAALKLGGQVDGLSGLRRDLGKRFEKAPRRKPDESPADAA
jgi:hypothetical protein